MIAREDRIPTLLSARMQTDGGWCEVTIANVSSRGMCLRLSNPPPVGTYIVVHRAAHTVVARAMWVAAGMLGVRSQDRINVSALIGQPAAGAQWSDPRWDRRKTVRAKPALSPVDQSQRIGSLLQFVLAIAVAALAAILIGQIVYQALFQIASIVTAALGGAPAG